MNNPNRLRNMSLLTTAVLTGVCYASAIISRHEKNVPTIPSGTVEPTILPTTKPNEAVPSTKEPEIHTKKAIWSSQGRNLPSWAIEVEGEDTACGADIVTDPYSCEGEYFVVKSLLENVVILQDDQLLSVIKKNENEFNNEPILFKGKMEIFGYDNNSPFVSTLKESSFMFKKEARIVLKKSEDGSTKDIINLEDGRTYRFDDIDQFIVTNDLGLYTSATLKCEYDNNDNLLCNFKIK